MVKYIKGPNVPINDLEGDENIDSDCEDGYLAAASDAKLKVEQDEEESRAVLTTGSFSAYAIFPRPILTPREMTNYPVGSPSSSIAARTISCSPPSHRKATSLA